MTRRAIGTLTSVYRTLPCIICGHAPKVGYRAKGVQIACSFRYGVTYRPDVGMRAYRDIRVSGEWCLKCVKRLAARLDTAIDKLTGLNQESRQ